MILFEFCDIYEYFDVREAAVLAAHGKGEVVRVPLGVPRQGNARTFLLPFLNKIFLHKC